MFFRRKDPDDSFIAAWIVTRPDRNLHSDRACWELKDDEWKTFLGQTEEEYCRRHVAYTRVPRRMALSLLQDIPLDMLLPEGF